MAILIGIDGVETRVLPEGQNNKMTLDQIQRLVGGYFRPLQIKANDYLLVNEDGIMRNLPLNARATMLAGQTLVGPVIRCTRKEM